MEVLETVKFLPSTSVLPRENSVSKPLLRVLTQLMVGKGKPLAVQLRESGAGLRNSIVLSGVTVKVGGTADLDVHVTKWHNCG